MFTEIGKGHLAALAGLVVVAAIAFAWALSGNGDEGVDEIKVRTEAVRVKAKPFAGVSAVGRGTQAERKRAARIADGEYVPEPGSQEERAFKKVEKTYDGFDKFSRTWGIRTYVNVAAGLKHARDDENLKAICDLMSEDARKETVEYVRVARPVTDFPPERFECTTAVALLVRGMNQSGSLKPLRVAKVVGMNVEGENATASIDSGTGTISSIALVKEDGEWKLGASPVEDE